MGQGSKTKEITSEQHLKALALFTMAAHHAVEATRFYEGLKDILNDPDDYAGYWSDTIYGAANPGPKDFEKALSRAGFIVRNPTNAKEG